MDTNKVQYIETEENFKKLDLKYSVKNDSNIEIKVYDPNGILKDSGIVSINTPYNESFDNLQGKWKIELIPNNNDKTFI